MRARPWAASGVRPATALAGGVRAASRPGSRAAVRGAEREVSATAGPSGPWKPPRPLRKGLWEKLGWVCRGRFWGQAWIHFFNFGKDSPPDHPHPLPSPHPQSSSREPADAHLGSQGFRKPLTMSAVVGRRAATPARTEPMLPKAGPARRGARGACGSAGTAESERHSQWQKRRLRAARPLETDRQGAVTSGSWLRSLVPCPPITTTRFLVSPPPKEVSEVSKREKWERLPLVQNLQE